MAQTTHHKSTSAPISHPSAGACVLPPTNLPQQFSSASPMSPFGAFMPSFVPLFPVSFPSRTTLMALPAAKPPPSLPPFQPAMLPPAPSHPLLPPPASPTPSSSMSKWAVVTSASLVHALHAAAVYMTPSTLFSPMRHTLGLSIAEITSPLIFYRVIQAAFLIPAGLVLDRVGPERCLRYSMLFAALTAPLLACVTSLWQLMLLQGCFAVSKLFGGLSAMLLLVARVFEDGQGMGKATGVLLSGYSLAGFLAPAAIGGLAGTFGWRLATGVVAGVFGIVALPLTFIYLREPRNSTWHKVVQVKDERDGKKESLWSAGYISVAVATVCFSAAMHVMFDHLIVFLNEDFGMKFEIAAMVMSVVNLVALFTKLGVGVLADRYNKAALIAIFGGVAMVGCLALLDLGRGIVVTTSIAKVALFTVLYSVGYAAVFNLTTAVLPEFGREKLGVRANLNLVLLFASGSVASYAAGVCRSVTGSYRWPFLGSAFSFLMVCVAGIYKGLVCDRKKVDGLVQSTR